ncbi:hypothetical protein LQE88_11745 [Acidaminococcus sp. NSJ-142]|uniref:hypothetical protein n=1 Tax=Acidaminococcus hominis TaxID=2897706 RepID=UPI001E584152|nr:hypothetical protein [Acidaminococcus hominis]MCD2436639.1 hypothetical protein [Acidaminococcus hominis]
MDKMKLVEIASELNTLRQYESQYRKELFDKETEEEPATVKHKIAAGFDYDLIDGFEQKLQTILKASKIGGSSTARLNMKSFDIEINGISKIALMGGGEYTDTILPCARTFFTTLPQLFDHPSGSICHPAQ